MRPKNSKMQHWLNIAFKQMRLSARRLTWPTAFQAIRSFRFMWRGAVALAACASLLCHAAESVPNTLEEAFAALDKQLSAIERQKFQNAPESEAVALAHMGIGMRIRNEWFRAGGSALPRTLRVQHLDDASAIVLTSYWRHLNGKPLEVENQINCYHRWWQEQQRLIDEAKGASSYKTPAFSCPNG
ncbi:MAG: hypothetical protein FWC42_08370 [Proteobacteria bacterium]|nr:hypothetical protein [Pseudomonadota bacterium]